MVRAWVDRDGWASKGLITFFSVSEEIILLPRTELRGYRKANRHEWMVEKHP